MKMHPLLQRRPHGGIMAIALVGIGFVSLSLTAWVGILAQHGRSGEIEEHASRRRMAAMNSRATAREYALQRVITSSGDTDGFSFAPTALGDWSTTSSGAWSGYPMESNTRLAGLNAFGPAWDYPYSKQIDITATSKALGYTTTGSTGALSASYSAVSSYVRAYVRSRNPLLGGDLFIVHRSKLAPQVNPAVTGNIHVHGRAVHFVPELAANAYSARSMRFVSIPGPAVTVVPRDLDGNIIPPSNLAWTPMTFGNLNNAADFSGRLNVIDDPSNGGNSLRARLTSTTSTIQDTGSSSTTDSRGYANAGDGIVTITPCIGSTNPADLPSIVLTDEVSEIIIEGQTGSNYTSYAPYRPAFGIVYVQDPASSRKLSTIRLRNQGGRRFVLAVKQNGNIPGTPVNIIVEDSNAESVWNMLLIAENTPLTFTLTGGATTLKMAGGIQTDAPLTAPTGSGLLSLHLQSDTRGLVRLSPRAAWVETIMPEKEPGSTTENTW
jgi:hypothetical protein